MAAWEAAILGTVGRPTGLIEVVLDAILVLAAVAQILDLFPEGTGAALLLPLPGRLVCDDRHDVGPVVFRAVDVVAGTAGGGAVGPCGRVGGGLILSQ